MILRQSSDLVAPTPKRFTVTLPDMSPSAPNHFFAITPDGSAVAYWGGAGRESQIYLYTLADGASRAVPQTERALEPFFSPDGKWIGFSQDNRIKKIAISGGPPVTICEATQTTAASWGADDWIVFSGPDGLSRVPASGGAPTSLTTLASGERSHTMPQVLPGGKAVIFTALSNTATMDDATIVAVAIETGERTQLVKGGASARYSRTGHLVYVRNSDLVAVPFDLDRMRVTGTPFLAVPAVRVTPLYLIGQFDLATDGTLAYMPGGGSELQRTLVWIDRKGMLTPIPAPPRPYMHPSLLPDERGVIIEIEDTPHNISHYDLVTGALSRLTRDSANHRAVLSPDGRVMAFSSDRTVPRSLFRQAIDGSDAPEHLSQGAGAQNVTSWSLDGRWLAFNELDPKTKDDIWVLPLHGDRKAKPFLQTTASEQSAVFSPDGRWIAYSSDESGRREVMVAAFPAGLRKQVSTSGGEMPMFSHDGRELFYRFGDRIMAAPFVSQPLSVGAPRVAFEVPPTAVRVNTGLPNYAVNRKGDAVLAVRNVDQNDGPRQIQVVVNWFDVLRRAAGTQ